jgi:uncharacterized membrane protein YedE/YeeE
MDGQPRAYWRAHVAGALLGLALLLTFVLTGHGLGASGFSTALTATAADVLAPAATAANAYLGPMVADDYNPLSSWITWEVIGVAAGALIGALLSGRLRWRIEGPTKLGSGKRLAMAVAGGIVTGFGARVAAGCTSGLGLSGAATLATAGFVFLVGFFAAGLLTGVVIKRFWQ